MPIGADPLVTRIEPLRPRGLRVVVHLDHGEPFEVTLEALERNRLGVGDPLPPNRRHHLLDADADVRVRDAALNLISHRARTRAELGRRLRQKGFAPTRIEPCLDRLEEKGLIDDAAVAAAFVRDRLRHRPRGRSALSSELRSKGLEAEVVEGALERVFADEGVSDRALALEVAEKWVARQGDALLGALASTEPSPARDKARRRLVGYLTRRGFRGDALGAGVERATALVRGGDH
jgi:regulatory protein